MMAMNAKTKRRLQTDFLTKSGPNARLLKDAMDCLPHVFFNMKDAQGRIMAINPANCELCNIRSELDVIGKTSIELFPRVLAESYRAADQIVLNTGIPLLDTLEDHPADRSTTEHVSNRFPVRNAEGVVIGTCCIYYRRPERKGPTNWQRNMQTVTAYVDAHYAEKLDTPSLAKLVHAATTSFHRQFAQILGITPNEYLTTVRLNAARRLLEETDRLVADIAADVGFHDQSHFTKAFKKARGITPGAYRRQHRRS
jgi:AraC-like DNA-binding protein